MQRPRAAAVRATGAQVSLEGTVCLVTGGGSGIGRATALLMARRGAVVAVAGRTASKVDRVKSEIETLSGTASGTALSYALNVADRDAVFEMVNQIERDLGSIGVLVNAAGHSSPNRRLLTTTPDEIHSILESNLVGTIYCTQAVVPGMLEIGQGTIINVSSLAGAKPSVVAGMAYGAAKAAVINFTEFVNLEFEKTRIRASVVIPGEVDTPVLDTRPVPPGEAARSQMVSAEETAEAIVLIAELAPKTNIPELVIKPTVVRDRTAETPPT